MTDPANTTAEPEIIERLKDTVEHALSMLAGVQLEIFTLKRGVVGNFRHNHRKGPNLFGSIVAGC